MVELSSAEAKSILISMTKDGMGFDGEANQGKGALFFKKDNDSFISSFVKIASIVNGQTISSFEVGGGLGKSARYEIHNDNIVKRMCGYCQQPQRSLLTS